MRTKENIKRWSKGGEPFVGEKQIDIKRTQKQKTSG